MTYAFLFCPKAITATTIGIACQSKDFKVIYYSFTIFFHIFQKMPLYRMVYKFEVWLPFSRYRNSFLRYPALTKSLRARFMVLRDIPSSLAMVGMAGQQLLSRSARSWRYI